MYFTNNKAVLLHEHERHTVHHVASTCYAVSMGGGTPSSIMGMRYYGIDMGYPL